MNSGLLVFGGDAHVFRGTGAIISLHPFTFFVLDGAEDGERGEGRKEEEETHLSCSLESNLQRECISSCVFGERAVSPETPPPCSSWEVL